MEAPRPKTILLVEDEALIALAEKKTIEGQGYAVRLAGSGEEAIRAVRDDPVIDLVLMDINLGAGIDGTEAAEAILGLRDLPVVFLSSHVEPEVVEKTERISSYGYVVKDLKGTVLAASIKMAFRLFEANQRLDEERDRLRKSEERYALINDSSDDSIYSYDMQGRFTSANRRLCELLGLSAERIIGHTHEELGFPQSLCDDWAALHKRVYESDRTVISETTAPVADGSIHDFEVVLNPLHDGEGRIIGIGGTTKDITPRKRGERDLRESESLFRLLAETSTDMIARHDEKGRFLYVSPACRSLLGYEPEELLGHSAFDFFHPDDVPRLEESRQDIIAVPHTATNVFRIRRKDGTYTWFETTTRTVLDEGTGAVLELHASSRDVSARKRDEDRISSLLAEKELILKEVHHRIKNNMAIIRSLLSLQAGTVADPAATGALEDAGNRLQSMIVLYDKLYQSADFRAMSVSDYIPALVDEIIAGFPERPIVTVEKRVEDFELPADQLQPLGIILNEILTNSMKYAFIGRDAGSISVSAERKDGHVLLAVEDNGVGMPTSASLESPAGFGLMLMKNLARQLGGTIRLEKATGTRTVLEFP
jgi:PAS domain S-box-containing protein